MKIKLMILLVCFGTGLMLQADDSLEKLNDLKKKKQELLLKMHKKRVELIKNDPFLKELERKIIALHRELAIRVDNNDEMRKLLDELSALETKIKMMGGDDSE